ncbi:MAG: ATP-grasp domain-containing protein, partial [Rickettsiaceae bacterium]|nr:ATP-grasp domain-containing protein [Rickettsiaceae bacterium]
MNIHEYQAKQILREYGVPTGKGVVACSKEEIDSCIDNFDSDVYVVKAQIHAGGRGKAGGVKIAKTKSDAKKLAHEMYGITLVTHQTGPKGQQVRRIYIESGCEIKKEYYFSLVVDRDNSCITAIASTEGGVNIEEVAHNNPEKIIRVKINPSVGVQPFHARQISFGLGLKGELAKSMHKTLDSCYKAFIGT